MPSTTISNCSRVLITCGMNTHHRQQQRFRRVSAMMTSLWRGLCSRLHRPPGCPKPHQCVFDAIGYAGGGVRARVDVYYHNKSPSTRVIALTVGSWTHYRAWSGCSSPDKPPCLQKSISNNQRSNWGRGSGVYSPGLTALHIKKFWREWG
jgi:hypothetical protein